MDPRSGSEGANGLIAVLLITRSRPGPKLVFHHPRVPSRKPQQHTRDIARSKFDENDSETNDESNSDSDAQIRKRGASDSTVRQPEPEDADNVNPLEQVLGYEVAVLERLLSPGRWCEKKKFEICLDGITFVGLPIFSKEDGTWAARDDSVSDEAPVAIPSLRKDDSIDILADESQQNSPVKDLSSSVAGITITAPPNAPAAQNLSASYKHVPDSFDSHGIASLGTSMNSSSTTSGAAAEQMTMFHVVFALSANSSLKTAEVYEQVAKKLSKALKYCQKRSNYVSAESRKLLAIKQRARAEKSPTAALWTQLASHSELAWALQEVYTRIATQDIAGIRLDGIEMSLQIPPKPRSDEREISPLSALLFLEYRENLCRALDDHRDASLLSYFIRESTPTKSLAKQAIRLGIPEKTVIFLAQHLVKWRKARAIAPLHPRNIYVVHPHAPLNNLPKLGTEYAKRFPALPSMETMLAMLGSRPIKYGALIQSRDHRVPYMEILAWLVRHDMVAPMRTIGWLKTDDGDEEGSTTTEQTDLKPMPVSKLLGVRTSVASDDGSSVASDQTAFPTGAPLPAATATSVPNESSPGKTKSQGENDWSMRQVGIITAPLHPSSAERTTLRRIEASLEDPELRERFSSLVRYFDGKHTLEEIAGREGLKRAKVEEWLAELERGDCLKIMRCF